MLLKAGVLSLVLLLASRLLGVVRESVQAAAFGTTGMSDVAVLMLTLPDWLTSVIASGALAYVLLPHWAHQTPQQKAQAQRRVANLLLLLGISIGALLFLLQEKVAQLLFIGMPSSLLPQSAQGLALSALTLPAAMLAALWGIRLQHEQDFVGMFSANLVVNGVLISGLLFISNSSPPVDVLGLLALSLWMAMGLRLLWLRSRLGAPHSKQDVPTVAAETSAMPSKHLWLWAALSAGLPLTLPFVARTFASGAGEGALATFNYAWKLVELPMVLVIQLVATLVFPVITRAITPPPGAARGVHVFSPNAIQTVRGAFLITWTLACAATAGLQVGAHAIANLLFGWGRMPAESVATVAAWSTIGAWCLLPQALIGIALATLATLGRMRSAALAYGVALLALLVVGAWSHGDGAAMMGSLVAVLTVVSLIALLALRQIGTWNRLEPSLLPWRQMVIPTATMLGFTLTVRMGWMDVRNLKGPAGLAVCALSALGVVAVSYSTSRELRALLRRY